MTTFVYFSTSTTSDYDNVNIATLCFISGIACLLLYALSFTMVTTSGSYWLQIFENYCSGIPLLAIALVEVIAIAYGYGLRK